MRSILAFLLITAGPLPLRAAKSTQPDAAAALRDLVASSTLSDLQWPDFSDCKDRIRAFYEPAGYALAWIHGGQATSQAEAVVERLKQAEAKGLDPEDYDGSRWAGRLDRLSRGNSSGGDLARFDLALTVSLMRYLSDVQFGKANPRLFRAELFHTGFNLEGADGDLAGFVRHRLVEGSDVAAALDQIEPPYEGYRRTEEALRRYTAIARESRDGHGLPAVKKTIEPGSAYAGAAQLAGMLRELGDLPADAKLSPEMNRYAGPLVDAVKHFQMRHGLEPDGRLGQATLAQLNVPLAVRVRQLQLTLERWRWVPHGFSRPPIVVNIPEFQLRALNRTYATELEMKVVVGKAYHHQTPVFAAEMTSVIFRPYWDVPRSIERAELVPKVEQDRAYLSANGYEAVTAQGAVMAGNAVDDPTLDRLRSGELRVRQIPGPSNALGLVKFLFPNEHNVYLHGTPAAELFSKSRRDFSHGCIRVEKPEQLAGWVLRGQPGWTPERIRGAMSGGKTVRVTLDAPIPVLIVYATAVVLSNGEVRFFKDIYGEDAQLERDLSKGYPRRGPKPE